MTIPILLSLILIINPICKIDEKPCQEHCIKEYAKCKETSSEIIIPDNSISNNVTFESDEDFQLRKRKLQLGLIIPSLLSLNGVWVTLIVARKSNPNYISKCPNGKECGNSCISWEDTCHKGSGNSTYVTKTGWIVSGTLFAVGLGLLIATIFAPSKMKKRQIVTCGVNGCSLEMKF